MSTAILIVNFRGYDDLDRCLQSLTPQLRPGDEVIVVDHESDPACLRLVAARHPRILTVPSAHNPGFAAGANRAARCARAPFLCLLNPDTIVDGLALGVMENWLETHPEVAVVGPRVLNADGSTQPSARRFPGLSTAFGGRSTWLTRRVPNNWLTRRNLLGLESRDAVNVDWVAGACLMTRRDVFERIGGLDESFFLYWEDADYCRRVAATGRHCTYLPAVTVRHVGGGSSKYDLDRAIRAFHASAFRLYWKHTSAVGRLGAPFVRAGLSARGELRLWQARRNGLASVLPQRSRPDSTRYVAPHTNVEQSVSSM